MRQCWPTVELEITSAKWSHAVTVQMNLSAFPRFQCFKAYIIQSGKIPGDLITPSRSKLWGTSSRCLDFVLPGRNEVRRSEDPRLGKWKKGQEGLGVVIQSLGTLPNRHQNEMILRFSGVARLKTLCACVYTVVTVQPFHLPFFV